MSQDPKPQETWTIRRVLDWTRGHFEKQQLESARLTAELLLAHVLSTTRVKLFMDLDRPLTKEELATYRALIQRRLAFEPTQYLIGHKEFYGRRFAVDRRVLIPRSETELLVEGALQVLPKDTPARVLDLCTGSGCVAISIAAERPLASVWATDRSPDALAVAKANAEALGVSGRVTFFEGDLLSPLPVDARFDVIVSNPPYVPTGQLAGLQKEVQHEPKLALDGGADGLAVIRPLVAAALPRLKPGGWLALEIAEDQGAPVKALLDAAGAVETRIEKDLARHDRLVFGRARTS
ncbi:MAG: peptide chain release factor N(5)-glutamine methyltransferase [Myxococcaceae bacterium]|nr:peptide chain release factor N(5)-glutamine methyltransferase [Myxococcaceae bacterium]